MRVCETIRICHDTVALVGAQISSFYDYDLWAHCEDAFPEKQMFAVLHASVQVLEIHTDISFD